MIFQGRIGPDLHEIVLNHQYSMGELTHACKYSFQLI